LFVENFEFFSSIRDRHPGAISPGDVNKKCKIFESTIAHTSRTVLGMSSTPRVTRSRRASIAPTASIRAESPVAKPAPRVRARASAKVDPQPESSSHSIVPAAAVDDGTYTDNDGQTQHQQQDTVDADRPVRWYYDPADNATVQNVTIDFMYNPHSLLALAVFLAAILGAFFYYDSNAYSAIENIKNGLALAAGVFLLIGLLVFPSGPFTRPHPMFWRLVFGVSLLYELVLVVMLMLVRHYIDHFSNFSSNVLCFKMVCISCQNREQARFSLTYLYPNLNQPLVEKQYAAHCELTWENVKPAVFDIFFVSHFLGWLCKSLMMRDLLFCWTLSVGWELIEIAFMHMLPNFAECWWDQWILDVMLANGIGIYCGHLIAQHLEVPFKFFFIRCSVVKL
jgi:hypothetical protein